MKDLVRQAGPNGRVSAILQVSDVNSREVRSLLARNGVIISDSMAKLGAMKVDLPAHVIETLMQNGSMNFISPDVKIESSGHVTATTGADQIRNAPGLLGSLLGGTAIDGTGVTIAIIDSGMDLSHVAFQPSGRLKFKKDFTPENKPDKDFYGHGSHVASLAAGNYTNGTGTSYQGIAYNANLVNLRVLDSNGVGSTSTLLAALNWFLTPADPNKPLSSTNPLNKDKYAIRVVNMSLGAPAVSSYQNDPICRASRALVDAGIVVVAASGNNGKDANGNKIYGQIHSPGNEQ
jgi:serine protease AprX